MAIFLVVVATFQIVLTNSRRRELGGRCLFNLRSLAFASYEYANDSDGVWPTANWLSKIAPYNSRQDIFQCPAMEGTTNVGYAVNVEIAGKSIDTRDAGTPLVFDSAAHGQAPVAPISSLPNPARHPQGNAVCYTDEHVGWELPSVQWSAPQK